MSSAIKNTVSVVMLIVLVMGLCSLVRRAHAEMPIKEHIVFAGGCFWGVEAVFDHIKGVAKATSGYAGGEAATAHYERVSEGDTGHAESVEVEFDPSQVTLDQLLDVYFIVAHDPTQLNRQGPDEGTQYRSEVFVTNAQQEAQVKRKIAELDKAKKFDAPIVTKVELLKAFYPAEEYHQNYLALHPTQPYIVMHDLPKLARLRLGYASLYKD